MVERDEADIGAKGELVTGAERRSDIRLWNVQRPLTDDSPLESLTKARPRPRQFGFTRAEASEQRARHEDFKKGFHRILIGARVQEV